MSVERLAFRVPQVLFLDAFKSKTALRWAPACRRSRDLPPWIAPRMFVLSFVFFPPRGETSSGFTVFVCEAWCLGTQLCFTSDAREASNAQEKPRRLGSEQTVRESFMYRGNTGASR